MIRVAYGGLKSAVIAKALTAHLKVRPFKPLAQSNTA